MESTATISSIILGGVTAPYAIAFHPETHLYYPTNKAVSDMNTDDWRQFVSEVLSGSAQVSNEYFSGYLAGRKVSLKFGFHYFKNGKFTEV